jgi:hypothetical protein
MSHLRRPIVCRDPDKDEWIRVKSGEERRAVTPALRHPDTGDVYIASTDLWPMLASKLLWVGPRVCINHEGEIFVWAVPFPPIVGGARIWPGPAGIVADLAEMKWCRVSLDSNSGQYTVATISTRDKAPEPAWPDIDFLDAAADAFRGRVIMTPDHPLLRGLI